MHYCIWMCAIDMQPMRRFVVGVESALLSMLMDRMLAVSSVSITGAKHGRSAVSSSWLSVVCSFCIWSCWSEIYQSKWLLPKWPHDKPSLKFKTAPCLFTSDTFSFNNSTYHMICNYNNSNNNNACLTTLFPGLPIWILLEQETVSDSGITWAICKSAHRPWQITMPAPHHSVFLQARCPSFWPTNSVKALKAIYLIYHTWPELIFCNSDLHMSFLLENLVWIYLRGISGIHIWQCGRIRVNHLQVSVCFRFWLRASFSSFILW